MTLRQRTFAITGVAILVLTVILLFTANRILLTGFDVLERQNVEEDVRRAQNVLQAELGNLDDFAQDWAFWDDTYDFVSDRDDQYVKRNWVQSTFLSERLNAVMLIDLEGNLIYQQGFDLTAKTMMPVPTELAAQVDKLRVKDADGKVSGILMLQDGPMLVVARPILDSDKQMPVDGTVVVGRYLDKVKLSDLADTAQLTLSVEAFRSAQIPSDFETARDRFTGGREPVIVPLTSETIAGYSLIRDIEQNPALILKVEIPRHIYQQGQQTLGYLIVALLAIGLAFGLIHMIILKKTVLDRVAKLSSSVLDIGRGGNPCAHVDEGGNDEVSHLAGSINNMLHSLELAEYELRTSEAINRMILEKIPDSILLLDKNGKILDFKTGKYRHIALPPLLFPGKTLTDIYPKEIAARFMQHIKAAIETRTQQVYDQKIIDNNHTVHQEIRIDVSGEDEVIALIRDFTQPKKD